MWFGAPLWSGVKWLNGGRCRGQRNEGLVWPGLLPDPGEADSFDVNEMLLNAPGGVDARSLFAYLVDPMNDPEVRQDEIKRRTTVEHIKFLRNRLENTAKKQNSELRVAIGDNIDKLRGETRQREKKMEQKLDEAVQMIEEARHREKTLEQKLEMAMAILGNVDLILRHNIRSTVVGQMPSS